MFDFEFLNLLLIRAGMNGRDLAEKLSVSEWTVHNWLAGKVDPRIERIPALAQIFKVNQKDFLKGEK